MTPNATREEMYNEIQLLQGEIIGILIPWFYSDRFPPELREEVKETMGKLIYLTYHYVKDHVPPTSSTCEETDHTTYGPRYYNK